jgi:WD40 repeat protein
VTGKSYRAVSGAKDNTLKVWELESGRELRTLRGHSNEVTAVAVTPDGQLAISASGDQTLKVWELESGHELRTLLGHSCFINAVAVTADGQRAVSASDDQTLKVWDLATGRELHTLRGHTGYVTAVAIAQDGRHLVSGGLDNTVRIWAVGTGGLVATCTSTDDGWAAFATDGRYKWVGNLRGAVWYAISLCRFEMGELDEFLPPGTLRRIEPEEPLFDNLGE